MLKPLLQHLLSQLFPLFLRDLEHFACQDPLLRALVQVFNHLLPFFVTEVKHAECVADYVFLNFIV